MNIYGQGHFGWAHLNTVSTWRMENLNQELQTFKCIDRVMLRFQIIDQYITFPSCVDNIVVIANVTIV